MSSKTSARAIQQLVDELLDAVADRPGFDLMTALAAPLPITIIAEMIGVDPSDQDKFRAWLQAFAASLDAMASDEVIQQALSARNDLAAYLEREIANIAQLREPT